MILERQSLSESATIDLYYRAIAEQGVNLYMLPEEQQDLLNWLASQEATQLADIATYLGQDLASTRLLMQSLITQGFVQEAAGFQMGSGVTSGRPRRSGHKETDPELSLGRTIAVILSPSGDHSAPAGSSFEVSVTVFNRGNRNALFDVYIDDTAQVVRRWCASPSERLALAAGQSNEVIFRFQVPVQTLPGTYTYQLVVDSPQHYPEETPLQFTKHLQILPPTKTAVQVKDPTFSLIPATRSTHPTLLQPGATLEVQVQVHNRSDRVDRFRLACPDLSKEWYRIRYPEGIDAPGLVTGGSELRLNPNSKGEILLYLTPPLQTAAGNYNPTLRLYSANHPNLNLLDVVYLQVAPIYRLTADLQTLISKVRRQPAAYRLLLNNTGNTQREVLLHVRSLDEEDDRTYHYTWHEPGNKLLKSSQLSTPSLPAPQSIQIPAKQTTEVGLQVKPALRWRRPWLGLGKVSNFEVMLEDPQQLPLPTEPLQGTLVWKARPWWQFLLLLLAGMGSIATLVYLIWSALFRPPAPPAILEFSTASPSYPEAEGKSVQLNWQISNPRQIDRIRILGRSQEDKTVSSLPIVYDFRQGIPSPLQPFCTATTVLTCRNVPTDARQVGKYVFELQVTPPQGRWSRAKPAPITATTDPVTVTPLPPPKIAQFTTRIVTPETLPSGIRAALQNNNSSNSSLPGEQTVILRSWKVTNPAQIQEVQLLSRTSEGAINSERQRFNFSQGIPEPLRSFCVLAEELMCENVPVVVSRPGDYTFELAVTPRLSPTEPGETKKADLLKVEAKPPRILSVQINGQEALPKYLVPIVPGQATRMVTLTWKVEPGTDTKAELLPTPGTVPLTGTIAYPLVQQPGSAILTLRVTNASGKTLSRAIEFQIFDPAIAAPGPAPNSAPPIPSASPSGSPSASGFPSSGTSSVPPIPLVLPGSAPSPAAAPANLPAPESLIPLPTDNRLIPTEAPPRFN
ncbi:MAG: hypothetical protein SFW36_08000 [Leptolyngbyaceae cyanobacterium bins.59]|nr:hypothetical protein [Leptolyngbyaceae cyanobacterium bins.59]